MSKLETQAVMITGVPLLEENELLETAIADCREDLYDPGWSSGEDGGNVPLIAVLVSLSAGCAAVASWKSQA